MPSMFKRLLVLATLTIAAPATAGVVFDIETNDLAKETTYKGQVFAQGRHFKMTVLPSAEDAVTAASTMIFDADRREMIVIDDARQSYVVIDEKMVHSMAEQVKEARAKTEHAMENMEGMLSKLPEDQRAMVEKMMKERMKAQAQIVPDPETAPTPKLEKTGEHKKLNGHSTTRFDVYRENEKLREMWVASWDEIEGGEEASAVFASMVEFMENLTRSFASESGLPGLAGGAMGGSMFAYMKELGGFPVLTREFDGETLTSESTLRGSQRMTIEAAAFKPPKGYTRQTMLDGSR